MLKPPWYYWFLYHFHIQCSLPLFLKSLIIKIIKWPIESLLNMILKNILLLFLSVARYTLKKRGDFKNMNNIKTVSASIVEEKQKYVWISAHVYQMKKRWATQRSRIRLLEGGTPVNTMIRLAPVFDKAFWNVFGEKLDWLKRQGCWSYLLNIDSTQNTRTAEEERLRKVKRKLKRENAFGEIVGI